jgi:hypothetical protein
MSEKKKDLSAFLKKNQKKGKKEPAATAPVEEKKEVEVEAVKEETKKKSTTQKKEESSDEEVDDELDLQTQAMSYGNIKEKKDITSTQKQEEAETVGFGFDNTVASGAVSGNTNITRAAKKDASDITFGGSRPKFGRKVNKGQFGAEFSEGLDDIDDDGNVKNKTKFTNSSKADGGQREFINLGSKARVGGRPEEEKFESAKPMTGVKPTFRGKLNLMKNTNEQDGDFGVKVNYDFKSNVSYPTQGAGENKERKPRAVPFEKHMAQSNAAEDDEGFEIVKNKERKPRKQNHGDSSDSNGGPSDGTKITRGDTRGTRGGRGGFFKNSTKNNE